MSALALLDELISELSLAVATASGGQEAQKAAGKGKGGGNDSSKQQKKGSGRDPAPSAPPAAAAKGELTINSLDLRVGVIVSVQKHETADKLYCEMIDIGEAEPRAIASGLVPHYTLEEMQGRRLIVVANLKPRNLVGFKSYGMVLCAAKVLEEEGGGEGKEKVEFVDPPLDAPPGTRIVGLLAGGGSEAVTVAAALSPAQVDKQKAFEVVGAGLCVNAQGVCVWLDKDKNEHVLQAEGASAAGEASYCRAPTLRSAVVR